MAGDNAQKTVTVHINSLMKRLTIQDMQASASTRGGKCLSETYVNNHVKLIWECKYGHKWEAVPNSIRQGTWCPHCAKNKHKLTIIEMHQLAKKRGGKCLSNNYININEKLLWECSKGHRWKAEPDRIKRGTWCPHCAKNKKLTIEEIRKYAQKRGGRCLSNKYVNGRTSLLWECNKGHTWKTKARTIIRGSWCPDCNNIRLNIEEAQKVAKDRGGMCLSENYKNLRSKLLWECSHGHKWEASFGNIKNGKWCPYCSSFLSERICREFFEQLFKNSFPKSFPKWLINKNGNRMELDGYCKKLGLAFEHHGEQHYSTKSRYIKDTESLARRQENDRLKKELCKQNNIVLIEIPQLGTRLAIGSLIGFIKDKCKVYSVPIPSDFDTKQIDLTRAYSTNGSVQQLKLLKSLANKHGGKCLSKHYIHTHKRLLWECKKGHQWEAVPSSIKQGHWCPICKKSKLGASQRLTIDKMRKLAKKKGGNCLSKTYVNSKTYLLWVCEKGHQWQAKPYNIQQGRWCPFCTGRGKTIEDMRLLAQEKGGRCLSSLYVNSEKKLIWQCAKGHKWEALPGNIKRGHWCAICARNFMQN